MRDLKNYLQQVRTLKVADAQPEVLTFGAFVNEIGRITYQSPSIRITPGYMFACEQIRAVCPMPPQMTDDTHTTRYPTMMEFAPFIGFNVLNSGQNRIIFKLPLSMGLFVNSLGSTEGLKFETPITFFEGADISVAWFVDVLSLLRTWQNPIPPRYFDPSLDPAEDDEFPDNIRVEFYAMLIGSIIRAENIV